MTGENNFWSEEVETLRLERDRSVSFVAELQLRLAEKNDELRSVSYFLQEGTEYVRLLEKELENCRQQYGKLEEYTRSLEKELEKYTLLMLLRRVRMICLGIVRSKRRKISRD